MSKITALEIRQRLSSNERPQRILDKIVEDFASSQEEREDLYDVIVEYSRQMQKQALEKQMKRMRSDIDWL